MIECSSKLLPRGLELPACVILGDIFLHLCPNYAKTGERLKYDAVKEEPRFPKLLSKISWSMPLKKKKKEKVE